MSWKLSLFAGALFCAIGLTSCTTFPRKSDANTIYYPTVSDMERYESQWGTKPRSESARTSSTSSAAGAYVPSGPAEPGPAVVPLESAQPTTPPAVPPSLR